MEKRSENQQPSILHKQSKGILMISSMREAKDISTQHVSMNLSKLNRHRVITLTGVEGKVATVCLALGSVGPSTKRYRWILLLRSTRILSVWVRKEMILASLLLQHHRVRDSMRRSCCPPLSPTKGCTGWMHCMRLAPQQPVYREPRQKQRAAFRKEP